MVCRGGNGQALKGGQILTCGPSPPGEKSARRLGAGGGRRKNQVHLFRKQEGIPCVRVSGN